MTGHWRTLLLAAAIATIANSTWMTAATEPANPRAAAIAEFNKRIKDYVALHKKVASGVPPLKQSLNAAEIKTAERALGDALRAARTGAKQGDIFFPDVTPVIRDMVREYYKAHPAVSARKEMLDEVPVFRPAVNQIYPETLPKGSMPPDLLINLPALPDKTVEYRIVGTFLTLRDAAANIIVDFLPGALPPAAKKQEDKS
jgi:hypothetical protein